MDDTLMLHLFLLNQASRSLVRTMMQWVWGIIPPHCYGFLGFAKLPQLLVSWDVSRLGEDLSCPCF